MLVAPFSKDPTAIAVDITQAPGSSSDAVDETSPDSEIAEAAEDDGAGASDDDGDGDDSGSWRRRVWGIQRAWIVTGVVVAGLWAFALLLSSAAG